MRGRTAVTFAANELIAFNTAALDVLALGARSRARVLAARARSRRVLAARARSRALVSALRGAFEEFEELESLILILNLILAESILGILSSGSSSLVDDSTISIVGISSLSAFSHFVEHTSEVGLLGGVTRRSRVLAARGSRLAAGARRVLATRARTRAALASDVQNTVLWVFLSKLLENINGGLITLGVKSNEVVFLRVVLVLLPVMLEGLVDSSKLVVLATIHGSDSFLLSFFDGLIAAQSWGRARARSMARAGSVARAGAMTRARALMGTRA
jgi:hypothetical protein